MKRAEILDGLKEFIKLKMNSKQTLDFYVICDPEEEYWDNGYLEALKDIDKELDRLEAFWE